MTVKPARGASPRKSGRKWDEETHLGLVRRAR
ncbi:endonuclease III, partial [Mycolicibacterium austroafricanum]